MDLWKIVWICVLVWLTYVVVGAGSKSKKKSKKDEIGCRLTIRGAEYNGSLRMVRKKEDPPYDCMLWLRLNFTNYLSEYNPQWVREAHWHLYVRGLPLSHFYKRVQKLLSKQGSTPRCRNVGGVFPRPSCPVLPTVRDKNPILYNCSVPMCSTTRGPFAGRVCQVTPHGREAGSEICVPRPGYPPSQTPIICNAHAEEGLTYLWKDNTGQEVKVPNGAPMCEKVEGTMVVRGGLHSRVWLQLDKDTQHVLPIKVNQFSDEHLARLMVQLRNIPDREDAGYDIHLTPHHFHTHHRQRLLALETGHLPCITESIGYLEYKSKPGIHWIGTNKVEADYPNMMMAGLWQTFHLHLYGGHLRLRHQNKKTKLRHKMPRHKSSLPRFVRLVSTGMVEVALDTCATIHANAKETVDEDIENSKRRWRTLHAKS